MKLTNNHTVFVTGGSGSIGRKILATLQGNSIPVKALARSEKSAEVVRSFGAEAAMGDLLDFDALRIGMEGASYLIHAAADTSHGASSDEQNRINLDGTTNVYRAALETGVKRALHISSEAVLLNGKPLINADESHPMPTSFPGGYSKSKAAAENIALDHSRDGLEVVVLRPRFVWGLGDTTALPQLIDAARTGKLAWIGGGNYKISTTHLSNVVSGVLLGLEKGRVGEIYFVTDGTPVIFREFITKLLATQGVEAPTTQVPRWIVASVARIGDALSNLTGGKINGPMSWQEYATLGVEVTLNIEKARKELGYTPVMTIEQGLAELRQ